jgi:regulator of CtrA degradation
MLSPVGVSGWQLCRKLCFPGAGQGVLACAILSFPPSPGARTRNPVQRGAADMSEKLVSAVSFGERLANSQAFADLFRDGMSLVEETAAYLDGEGRQESKRLERTGALAYATESMRLTTRLMQLASWLLLHRAVKEGEMSLAQANKEKAKVKLSPGEYNDEENLKLLPERLRSLIQRSKALQNAVRRIDATIHPPPARTERGNPVARQLGLLRAAFERK